MDSISEGKSARPRSAVISGRHTDEPTAVIDALGNILREVGRASALTEDTFVGIGGRLESSISILESLTATFESLLLDLGGEEMSKATRALSQVAARIASLAVAPHDTEDTLGQISALTATTTERIARMRKAVKSVAVLAVNAKIAAAHIRAGGDGFSTFADEIGRALKIAQDNLDGFAGELAGMSSEISEAVTGQRALGSRREQAVRNIPEQLARSVSAIAARRKQAEATASTAQKKTLHAGQRIGSAVMAMQIGDTTRQRIEHTEYALTLMSRMFGRRNPTVARTEFDCIDTSAGEKESLLATVCALQSAQLLDITGELDSQVGTIVASLGELAEDARAIGELGRQGYASDDHRPGSFLSALEADVGEAQTLLEGLRTAQSTSDTVMMSVLATTKSLVGNISAIQSVEADIRLMGLNTTLRCGRLGVEGRPMIVIAQELRACSNLTAEDAEAVKSDITAMVVAAGRSAGAEQEQRIAEIIEAAAIMTSSVGLLGKIAQTLADALDTLDHQSAAVAAALEKTAAEITVNAEIGAILKQAAEALSQIQANSRPVDGVREICQEQLLAAISSNYTMARERGIHTAILTGTTMPSHQTEVAPVSVTAASADLDDIFF